MNGLYKKGGKVFDLEITRPNHTDRKVIQTKEVQIKDDDY